jgi:hypothetical protein
MKLKLSSTFMTMAILAFAVFSIASVEQIDKIFAKTQAAGDGSNSISGDKLSNAEKMKVIGNVLGAIFGGGSENNNPDNSFASLSKSPSTNSPSGGDTSGECIQSQGTGTKDFYCAGTHHHCVKGESPGCLLEGGRTS